MKFSIKNIFSKYDEIGSFLRSRSHLLKKSLMENFIFCAVLFLKKRLLLKPLLFTVSNKLLICSLLKQKGCNISFFSERDKNIKSHVRICVKLNSSHSSILRVST